MLPTSTRALRLSALTFAGLYMAAMFSGPLPEGAYSDARVLGLLADEGTRNLIILSGTLLTLAALALLPFVCGLAGWLRGHDRDSLLPSLVLSSGILYIAMVLLAGHFFSAYALGVAVGELPLPTDATLVRVLSDSGFGVLLVPGLMSAGVMILATSLLSRRREVLPGWLCSSGFVVAGLTLLGAMWVPQFLVPLWTVVAAFTVRARVDAPEPEGVTAA